MANFQGIIDGMCKSYAGDNGKMLLHMGALGWVLSSAAHIFMVAKSKHIDEEKKKFLLWQEGLDGVVNVGLYYTLTDYAKKAADWVAENKRMPASTIQVVDKVANVNGDALVDFFKKNADEFAQTQPKGLMTRLVEKTPFAKLSGKGISSRLAKSGASGFYKKAIDTLVEQNGLTRGEVFETINTAQSNFGGSLKEAIASLKDTKKPEWNQLLDVIESQNEFRNFKNGIGTAATILASVLAVSIITPIVRNKLTNNILKQRQEAPEDRKVFYNTAKPMPLVFKNVGGSLKV